MISYRCPCGKVYQAQDESAGTVVVCRACRREIVVPCEPANGMGETFWARLLQRRGRRVGLCLVVGLAALMGTFLYPPWQYDKDFRSRFGEATEYAWVFKPPTTPATIDFSRVLLQAFAVLVGTCLAAYLLGWVYSPRQASEGAIPLPGTGDLVPEKERRPRRSPGDTRPAQGKARTSASRYRDRARRGYWSLLTWGLIPTVVIVAVALTVILLDMRARKAGPSAPSMPAQVGATPTTATPAYGDSRGESLDPHLEKFRKVHEQVVKLPSLYSDLSFCKQRLSSIEGLPEDEQAVELAKLDAEVSKIAAEASKFQDDSFAQLVRVEAKALLAKIRSEAALPGRRSRTGRYPIRP